MTEPGGPDATRRTLVRGVVVLGAVGVGAGLSRVGEGTYKLASSESDVAQQAPAPVETAEPEPTASAEPTKKPAAKAEKSTKAKTEKKVEKTEATEATEEKTPTKAESTKTAKSKDTEKTEKAEKKTEKAKPKPAGTALGPSNKIPVGGGVIYKDKRVVVTQPKKGEYKAFDALCTHASCLVDQVESNVIHCPCHSAKFSAVDGSVIRPSVARRPLGPKNVTEADGTIYLT
jgi:nitrite reductase/ring-hydroxylating ferredoxin subunit